MTLTISLRIMLLVALATGHAATATEASNRVEHGALLTSCPSDSPRESEEETIATLYMPAWSPDGRSLTFEAKIGDKWVLMIIGADGAGLRRLTEPRYTSYSSSWSPDGKLITFVSDRDGTMDVYVMKADGSNVSRLTNSATIEATPRWSPDGRRISYITDRDGPNEIYVMNSDGSRQTRVTKNVLDILGRPAWTPDGKISFYATEKGKRSEGAGTPALLWTVRTDGTKLKSVGSTPAREFNPSWSPDGRRVAFDAHRNGTWASSDGGWEVWVKSSDGSERRRLTNNSVNDWGPAWSPDGTRIAYCSGMDNKYEIWLMKADGSVSTRLTHLVYNGPAPGEKR